jgi:hypothetical protein
MQVEALACEIEMVKVFFFQLHVKNISSLSWDYVYFLHKIMCTFSSTVFKIVNKVWSGIAVMHSYLSLYYTCYILYIVYAGVYVFIFVTVFGNLCLFPIKYFFVLLNKCIFVTCCVQFAEPEWKERYGRPRQKWAVKHFLKYIILRPVISRSLSPRHGASLDW